MIELDYFHNPAGETFDDGEQGSYADLDVPTRNNATIEWAHTLADVVSAVLGAGLRLELLHEHDYTLFPRFKHLVEDRELPQRRRRLPPARGPAAPAAHVLAARPARWSLGRRLLAGEVLGVDRRVLLPLVRELVLGEAGVDRAGLDAGVAVDALVRIDVELLDVVVIGLVGRRMDAVDRADLDAGVVLLADAGFGDDVSQGLLPFRSESSGFSFRGARSGAF